MNILKFLKKKQNKIVQQEKKTNMRKEDEEQTLHAKLNFNIDLPVISMYPTGSKHICNPPVESTDEDWLILTTVTLNEVAYRIMQSENWTFCDRYTSRYANDSFFLAFRKDKWNLIITDDVDYYLRFCAATALAKELNLQSKEDRVSLFNIVKNVNIKGPYTGKLP